MLSFIWDGTNQTVPDVCSVINIVEISHAVCFTIITSPTRWLSVWISNIKTKWARIAFCFQCFAQAEQCCHACFFQDVRQKKKKEERWSGRDPGRWGVGGRRWHALVSNLFESIAQFICFVSSATAEDNQTRRPLDSSYCQPPHPPRPYSMYLHPSPLTHTPPTPPFLYVTCWLKERQGNSWASPNREMSERDPHQNHVVMEMQESPEITDLHTGTQIQYTSVYCQAFMHTPINMFALCIFVGI